MTRFSVLTPVHDPPAEVLEAMLESVRAQTFGDWEHCLVDDGSRQPYVWTMLQSAAASDARVRVQRRAEGGGIVAATNDALAMAGGDFIALLDHDDALRPDAFARVAAAIDAHPDVDYLYTDEDRIDAAGVHFGPFLKPDWSPERMRAQMYTCHLSVFRRALVEEVGAYREGFDGSQDWDMVLRVTERARRVVHVPEVCYGWRAIESSVAASGDAKPWAHDAARRAIAEHIERIGLDARVEGPTDIGSYRILPALRSTPPVSIVIPSAGTARGVHGVPTTLVVNCVASIVEHTTYPDYEIVVVLDTSAPAPVAHELRALAGDRVRIVPYDRPFNFSEKINLGAVHSDGDHLLLLNDDIEVLGAGWRDAWPARGGSSEWIQSLVMYSAHAPIGAVGARLYFGDLRLQHVGIVVHDCLPSHPYRGFATDYPGYAGNVRIPCNYLAVTGACLMTRRTVFEEVGGLSPALPVNYNDVDYGLKLHQAGYRVAYDPEVELLHFESLTRDSAVHPEELARLQRRWASRVACDPYYHPLLYAGNHDFWPPPVTPTGELVL